MMTNTIVPALRSDVAATLLAEASWIGRDEAHALRSHAIAPVDLDVAAARQAWRDGAGRYVRGRIDGMVQKTGLRLAGADVGALYRAAEAAFTRRMTGED